MPIPARISPHHQSRIRHPLLTSKESALAETKLAGLIRSALGETETTLIKRVSLSVRQRKILFHDVFR
jgi:hypothetical protein